MADESHVVRGINWRETFPFTQIFRAFRVAIHPTKLILALVALIAIYFGGWLLDSIWPVQSRAIPAYGGGAGGARVSEIEEFERFSAGNKTDSFTDLMKAQRTEIEDIYAAMLAQYKVETDAGKAQLAAKKADLLGKGKGE